MHQHRRRPRLEQRRWPREGSAWLAACDSEPTLSPPPCVSGAHSTDRPEKCWKLGVAPGGGPVFPVSCRVPCSPVQTCAFMSEEPQRTRSILLQKLGLVRAMAAGLGRWNGTINGTWDGDELGYKCRFNEDFKYVLLPVSYGVVCVLGLCLNVAVLYIFLCRLKTWNASTTYMFHLAVSDALYAASLPLLVYYYSRGDHWPFSTVLCKLVRFLFYTNLYCSILFLTCISVHRCLGVLRPLRSLRWGRARYARRVAAAVWGLVLVCQAPVLYFVTTSTRGSRITCHDTSAPHLFNHFLAYISVMLGLLFAVPFATILVCYVLMARRLLQPAYGTAGGLPRAKRKSVRTIAVVLAVFALCFLPFHVTRTLYYSFRSLDLSCHTLNAINMAYKITRPLASANSCLDPVLYFLAGQRLVRFARDAKPSTNPTPTAQASRRLDLRKFRRTNTTTEDRPASSENSRPIEHTLAGGGNTKDIRL